MPATLTVGKLVTLCDRKEANGALFQALHGVLQSTIQVLQLTEADQEHALIQPLLALVQVRVKGGWGH